MCVAESPLTHAAHVWPTHHCLVSPILSLERRPRLVRAHDLRVLLPALYSMQCPVLGKCVSGRRPVETLCPSMTTGCLRENSAANSAFVSFAVRTCAHSSLAKGVRSFTRDSSYLHGRFGGHEPHGLIRRSIPVSRGPGVRSLERHTQCEQPPSHAVKKLVSLII